jgi:hypothetical protein
METIYSEELKGYRKDFEYHFYEYQLRKFRVSVFGRSVRALVAPIYYSVVTAKTVVAGTLFAALVAVRWSLGFRHAVPPSILLATIFAPLTVAIA